MLTDSEREDFALKVMEEVRRWPGVDMRPHPSPSDADGSDGVEFLLNGRQIGHVHSDCGVHLVLTKALKTSVINEKLAEPLAVAPTSGWAMFNPTCVGDADHAIWLLRVNYVRLRRQRLTPLAATSSELVEARSGTREREPQRGQPVAADAAAHSASSAALAQRVAIAQALFDDVDGIVLDRSLAR